MLKNVFFVGFVLILAFKVQAGDPIEGQNPCSGSVQPFHNKTIVISGVTHGIGRAMLAEFIRLGHRVAGFGRTKEEIADLQIKFPTNALLRVADVTEPAQIKQFADDVKNAGWIPDLLINNAGMINKSLKNVWEVRPEEFKEVVDVNLCGMQTVMHYFVPLMIEQRKGMIINFSSTWGKNTDVKMGPYCASKWGVEGLNGVLAHELPNGMGAVTVNPNMVNTALLGNAWQETASENTAPLPEAWARHAVPLLLAIRPEKTSRHIEISPKY
jgi:NADP-dependent 3-hydroxy acid dehydrogenase YdfG